MEAVRKWRTAIWSRLGGPGITCLILVIIYAVLFFTGSAPGLASLVAIIAFVMALVTLIRMLRRSFRQAIWRLRNRLIAAYVLIAVVPIVLILTLAGTAAYAVIGQMAVYMVDNELLRRVTFLTGSVQGLRLPGGDPTQFAERMAPFITTRFPSFDLVIVGNTQMHYPPNSTLQPPPSQFPDDSGLIVKNKRVYAWVHERFNQNEVT